MEVNVVVFSYNVINIQNKIRWWYNLVGVLIISPTSFY
jgi:hypothetical protein